MIRVVCGCGRVFKAEDRHSGKRTRCPACGASLVIGQGSSSDSGEGELEEVPSWWYPAMPPDSAVIERDHPGEADPEAMRTTVLEHGMTLTGGERVGPPERGRANEAPGRSLWTAAGAVAFAATLVIGLVCWTWWTVPISGKATAGRGPRPNAAPGEPGPGSAHFTPPDRGSPLHLEDFALAGRGAEDGRPGRPARRLRLLVPAYIYPNVEGLRQWRRLMDAAAKVDLVAVLNPDSGPGLGRAPEYAALVAEAADRGLKLVGYIDTQYAERPASEVKADVDNWVRLYTRISGFFLDRQPSDARHAAYIADISAYARNKFKEREALVVTSPGGPCDESYLARHATDVVCVFSQEGFADFELPANLREFDPSHYAAFVHHVADAKTMRVLLKEAIIKRVGWIYITDSKPPNLWGRLPTYWEDEVEALSQIH